MNLNFKIYLMLSLCCHSQYIGAILTLLFLKSKNTNAPYY